MADWSRQFDEPITLPDGGELQTLLDAGRHVEAMPAARHERTEWQTAIHFLLIIDPREAWIWRRPSVQGGAEV